MFNQPQIDSSKYLVEAGAADSIRRRHTAAEAVENRIHHMAVAVGEHIRLGRADHKLVVAEGGRDCARAGVDLVGGRMGPEGLRQGGGPRTIGEDSYLC
jgi:hypothetical protein